MAATLGDLLNKKRSNLSSKLIELWVGSALQLRRGIDLFKHAVSLNGEVRSCSRRAELFEQ
jgi:hypothetical protein